MSRRTIARTACAAAVGLGIVVPVSAAAGAVPAARLAPTTTAAVAVANAPALALAPNDCCNASISGLPGRFVVGGDPKQFGVVFHNTSDQLLASLQVVFAFSGNNLDPDNITLKRLTSNGSWRNVRVSRQDDTISATDSNFRFGDGLPPNGSTTFQYQLSFDDKTQAARVSLDVTVNGRASGRGFDMTELASTGAQFTVGTTAATPPKPTPKATPTQAATAVPSTPQTAGGIDTGPGGPPVTPGAAAANSGGSSLAWIAYIVGALLLLGGIAAIGTLLWRREPNTIETDWEDDGTELHRGGPTVYPVVAAHPTQPLPAAPPPGFETRSYGPPITYQPSGYEPPTEYGPPPGATPAGPYSGRHSADSTPHAPR